MHQILLRFADSSDIKNVFELSNSSFVRNNSINNKEILWNEHVEWFKNELNNKKNYFYIIETADKEFIGQLRLKFIQDNEYIISITMLKEFQKQRIGTISLQKLFSIHKNYDFIAYIKEDNMLSQVFFEKNKFYKDGIIELNNNIFFIYKRKHHEHNSNL